MLSTSIVSGTDVESFDGQYVDRIANSSAMEWWYTQAVSTAAPEGDNAPANVVISFNQDTNTTLQASSSRQTTWGCQNRCGDIRTHGQNVVGTWGTSGLFVTASNTSHHSIFVNASEHGVLGSLMMLSNAPHHYGCNSSTDPHFSSALSALPQGTTLSPGEEIAYNQFGWANAISGSSASVNFVVNGEPLAFSGHGYHDGKFGTQPLNTFVDSWYWLNAQVGPYDVVVSRQLPTNATRELTTGYLARSGVVLQNQCSIQGTRGQDASTLTPYGAALDSGNNATVPQGFVVEYTLEDGQQYSFNVTGLVQNPSTAVYRRWVGTVSGGAVGETQYEGTSVFEWLNPGMNASTPA
ncbi:hypothetical protein B0H21DRAFT_706391 [Amylocystis lapponica]|nr:hypothetical protein B0H21DRAFT_706391 [Amylocystis lapponica]